MSGPFGQHHVLLARRPGWRPAETLTGGVDLAGGAVGLADVAPRSVFDCPLERVVDLPGCRRAVLDAASSRVLVLTSTCQVHLVIGPLPGWEPVGLRFLAPDRLAVLDGHRLVHLFDGTGALVETVDDVPGCDWPDGSLRYRTEGRLVTDTLDSGLPGCRWHRVRLTGKVPPGCSVEVRTLTSDLDLTPAEVGLLEERWAPCGTWGDPSLTDWDGLVHGPAGQYLWLRLVLRGDGVTTPSVDDAEVHWPRETSLRHLPAVFAAGESDFLERYLALTDTVRASVTTPLDTLSAELDPRSADATTSRDFLDWLGGWVGMDGIAVLPAARRRRLVAAAAELYRRRGTPDGVARHVGLWVGRHTEVLEHFRLRRWAVLNQSRLGDCSDLFGPEIVRRLQLDEFSTIGEFALVSVPSPKLDPFAVFAHRYTLFVRAHDGDDVAALAATAAGVAEAVGPAHCAAVVTVVTAAARLGVQARLGLDAVVAGPPVPQPLGQAGPATLAGDPARGGLPAVGVDARVGSPAGIG